MPFTPTTFTVQRSGIGRPVIFLSGFACGGHVWDSTVEHLGDTAQSHVVTLAGFAGVPPVAEPSLSAVHAELVRFVVDNELESPVIIGHSLGGTMALWLAETVPGLGGVICVEGLPFLAGVDDPTMTESRAATAVEPVVARLQAMTDDDLDVWVRGSMGGMFTDPGDRERVLAKSARSDVATVAQLFHDGMACDLRPELGVIDAPVTLVIAVDSSTDADEVRVRRWRAQTAPIPDVDVVLLQGSHFVMYDRSEELHALVDRVVRGTDLFRGPDDPAWEQDRERIDQAMRDPWAGS